MKDCLWDVKNQIKQTRDFRHLLNADIFAYFTVSHQSLLSLSEYLFSVTVKPVLSGHSKIGKPKVLKTGGSLVQVKSIAEWEHSAILLTRIKRLLVLKTYFGVFF